MRRKGWKVAESTRHGLFSREVARNYGGHGPDGEVQIDGTIDDVLAEIARGKEGIDIGCGNRWVSRKAIEMFAALRMDACDIADGFLEIAGSPMQDPGLESRLHVRYGDATALPYQAAIADFALLVNVFCVLPEDGIPKAAREAARVLKPGGELLVTGPCELGRVFTNARFQGIEDPEAIIDRFENALAAVRTRKELDGLVAPGVGILRATMLWHGDRAELVRDRVLPAGTPILRLIPRKDGGGLVVETHWATQYKSALEIPELEVRQINVPVLNAAELAALNNGRPDHLTLGPAYALAPAFQIWRAKKR